MRESKCVQLVQGEIMLISITIILLLNFEKNISYVFLFLRNFKISFPSVFTVYLEKNGGKTLQLTSINFVYMPLPDLQRIARIAMARCTREAKFKEVQRHYINFFSTNFLLCCMKFIPL